jgi:DNA-binding response OmpR family regulator
MTGRRIVIIADPDSGQLGAQIQAMLRAQLAGTPLLPVVRTADLPDRLDGLLHGTADFLVTPLREAEMRARVRRLLPVHGEPEPGWGSPPVDAPWALDALVGEDLAFLVRPQLLTRIETRAKFQSGPRGASG